MVDLAVKLKLVKKEFKFYTRYFFEGRENYFFHLRILHWTEWSATLLGSLTILQVPWAPPLNMLCPWTVLPSRWAFGVPPSSRRQCPGVLFQLTSLCWPQSDFRGWPLFHTEPESEAYLVLVLPRMEFEANQPSRQDAVGSLFPIFF